MAAGFTRIVAAALISAALAAPGADARVAAVTITFTAAPAKASTSPDATIDFTTSVPATFQCYLDGKEMPKPCVPPVTYKQLPNGGHSFSVVATATAPNGGKGKAAYSWTMSVPPPQTTITSGPSGTVTETTATFSFDADQRNATFSCTLDGSAATPCTSGVPHNGLAVGTHTFTVAATTSYGTDSTPATATWTVAPDTSITSGPENRTHSRSGTFTFTSTSASATFECSLDGSSGFTVCSSPQSYERLEVGSHTFAVRATSGSLADPTPAQRTWEILAAVVTPPDTTITRAPPSSTASTTAVVAFRSPQERATFECSLDGSAFASCASPARFTGLRPREHRVAVRAVLNGVADKTPATASWTLTPTAPHTRFTRQPQPSTHDADTVFGFVARPRGATFECSLDGAPFAVCASPLALHGLSRGGHELRVRARVGDIVEVTPVAASWRILAAPFPWLPVGAGFGAGVAVLASALGWGIRALRRRRWQRNAHDEERPQTCTVPQEYVWRHHCKVKPSLAAVEQLVLDRAENGGRVERELEGAIVDRLNRAARVARLLGVRRVRRPVARAAVELAAELDRWIERPEDIEISARLAGGKAECEFTRYECVDKAGRCTWEDRASWKAEVEIRSNEEVGTVLWSPGAGRAAELEPPLLGLVAAVAGRRVPAPEAPPIPEA